MTITENVLGLFNYGATIFLVLLGIYVMIAKKNLVRKIIGMSILQTGVILFYVSIAEKKHSAIPIVHQLTESAPIDPSHYANPLPHALMLTAIVVAVSTLGVALSLMLSIYRTHKTLEEDEILAKMEKSQ